MQFRKSPFAEFVINSLASLWLKYHVRLQSFSFSYPLSTSSEENDPRKMSINMLVPICSPVRAIALSAFCTIIVPSNCSGGFRQTSQLPQSFLLSRRNSSEESVSCKCWLLHIAASVQLLRLIDCWLLQWQI